MSGGMTAVQWVRLGTCGIPTHAAEWEWGDIEEGNTALRKFKVINGAFGRFKAQVDARRVATRGDIHQLQVDAMFTYNLSTRVKEGGKKTSTNKIPCMVYMHDLRGLFPL